VRASLGELALGDGFAMGDAWRPGGSLDVSGEKGRVNESGWRNHKKGLAWRVWPLYYPYKAAFRRRDERPNR